MKITSKLGLLALLISLGCSSGGVDRQEKREQDRMAMKLSDTEMLRDQYKKQLEKAQADLMDAQKRLADSSGESVLLRKQIGELQTKVTQLSSENEKLSNEVSRLNAKATSLSPPTVQK